MEQKKIISLDQKDIKISELLVDLGIQKNIAKSLIYVAQFKKECNSSDIEAGAGLRQPEVSIAMQILREKGWVKKREKKKKGKGRPVYLYTLKETLLNIIDQIEKDKQREIEKIKKDLEEIKKLISS